MSGLVLVVGIIAGVTLSGLLACTIVNNELKVWPTSGKGSWQSRVFWSLFRTLNVATLALAFLDWRSWEGFSLQRGIGGSLAIVCFALLRLGVLRAWAEELSTVGVMVSSWVAFIAGLGIRNTQPQFQPISA